MNTKAWITSVAFVAFVAFGVWWWSNKCKQCNCEATNTITTPASTATATTTNGLPLSFNWNNAAAIKGANFDTYSAEALKNLGSTDTLVITSYFYTGEANGQQLALKRADAIKALYPTVPAAQIKVITQEKQGEESYKTQPFTASVISSIANTNSLVKKQGNNITIYFASNANAKNLEKEIDDYLTSLSDELKANASETVTATGYTDNVGDDAKNQALSELRANFLKTILIQKGADSTKITVQGKGKANPVATNDTEAGRKLNRRVEITINNQ